MLQGLDILVDAHLLFQDLWKSENEATLCSKLLAYSKNLLVSIYVDDLLITRNDDNLL